MQVVCVATAGHSLLAAAGIVSMAKTISCRCKQRACLGVVRQAVRLAARIELCHGLRRRCRYIGTAPINQARNEANLGAGWHLLPLLRQAITSAHRHSRISVAEPLTNVLPSGVRTSV
mgnify:CR=1 FL=1|jgi:hypothetical protein